MNILKSNKWLKSAFSAGAIAYYIGLILNFVGLLVNHLPSMPPEMITDVLFQTLLKPIVLLIALAFIKSRNVFVFILGNAYILYMFVGVITNFINNIFNLNVAFSNLCVLVGGTVLFSCAVAAFVLLIKSFIKKL